MIILFVNGSYVFAMPDTPVGQIANVTHSSVVRLVKPSKTRFTVRLYPVARTVGDLMHLSQEYHEGLPELAYRIASMVTPSRRWVSGQELAKVLTNGKHGERYVLHWEYHSEMADITSRHVGREREQLQRRDVWMTPKGAELEHGVLM